MEKFTDMEFEEWELIPDTKHTFLDIKHDSEKDLLISNDIDISYFSDDKDSKILDDVLKPEFKDIEVVPSPLTPTPPIGLFENDQLVDAKIDSPKINVNEVEEYEQNEEDDELYKDEKDSEKETVYVEPEIKEKQAFWMVGALCSIGVAAATICIIALGKDQLHKNHNKKFQFQLYSDEKRIKEVVKQATRMNRALSAVRGDSNAERAQISFGGYYGAI